MEDNIKVSDKEFVMLLKEEQIQAKIKDLAIQIQSDFHAHNPVFLVVLKGAFFFAASLIKQIDLPCEISFIKVSSYAGDQSSGEIKFNFGLTEGLSDRNILIIEDIVDSGLTIYKLLEALNKLKPRSVKIATLVLKPKALKYEVPINYFGFELGNEFLLGFGMDYNEKGRNLQDIYRAK